MFSYLRFIDKSDHAGESLLSRFTITANRAFLHLCTLQRGLSAIAEHLVILKHRVQENKIIKLLRYNEYFMVTGYF